MPYLYDDNGNQLYDDSGNAIQDSGWSAGSPSDASAVQKSGYQARKPSVLEKGAQAAFKVGQGALAFPLSVGEATGRTVLEKVNRNLKSDLLGTADAYPAKGFSDYFSNAWNKRGEGVRSIGSNPLNLATLIPGAQPFALAGRVTSQPILRAGLATAIGAGEGGGMAYADAVANPQNGIDPVTAAKLGLATGGGLTALGSAMGNYGVSQFPMRASAKVPQETIDMVRQNLPDILSAGAGPKTRQGFADLAEKMRMTASKRYEAAEAAVPGSWAASVGDLNKSAEDALLDRLASRHRMAAVYNPDTYAAEIPPDAVGALGRKFNATRATQAYAKKDPEWLTAQEIGLARTAGTDPRLYQNPTGEAAMMAKDIGGAYHSAMTDALMGAPNYASTLGAGTQKKYALAKALGKVVANPGGIGLTDRLPGGLTLSPWLKASLAFKGGSAAQKSIGPLTNLGQVLGYPGLGWIRQAAQGEQANQ